jgi:AraC family transcriptional regulator of adaptative response/methylated-DNA-[protein]-cysteine methyltransferase
MVITDTLQIDQYYQALLDRDSSYNGIFFVGVKTTGIFCIATCSARKPKKENVVFYPTVKPAMDDGFRPCKVCKPTEHAHQPPSHVLKALELIKQQPKQKVNDQQLRENDLSPETLRRWFNTHYGMTFQTYQRMFRINTALEELKKGVSSTTTAYENGYESLSGFGYTYKKLLGTSPAQAKEMGVITIDRLTTPLGPMFACATADGLCLLEFTDRKMLETEFEDLQKRLRSRIIIGENPHIKQVKSELAEYFEGTRKTFNIKLDTPGTDFQQKVWSALLSIPYGQTASYAEQAKRLGDPKAVRAVASANGFNRVAIVIPCHRVIGSDGSLTGYAGGLERKKWLLQHELSFVPKQEGTLL